MSNQERSPSLEAFRDAFDQDAPPEIEIPPITAVVLCHNEALRLPYFLEHHKAAGVGHFIVVDNASDDGSAAILDADPAVTRLSSRKAYSDYKAKWREIVADHYLADRWALFLDVDELFVYPGWPERSIGEYCGILETAGYECLFTIMVDMYPAAPLSECRYRPGEPFVDVAPYFDIGNYRMEAYLPKQLADWPTPPAKVRGGARERIFHEHAAHVASPIDNTLIRVFMNLERDPRPGPIRRWLDAMVRRRIDRRASGIGLPNMSKVALIRWTRGCRFYGGVHRISLDLPLAPDRGALLHFKYFDDFGDKVSYSAKRGQHVKDGAHYKLYQERSGELLDSSLMFHGSRRFDGVASLVRAGLMKDALSLSEQDQRRFRGRAATAAPQRR